MKTTLYKLEKLIKESIIKELEAYHGGPKGITKFLLYGDNVNITARLMGTGIYVTMDKKEAESYSKGHVYTLEVPDDNGNNYLDFSSPVPNEILSNVAENLKDYVPEQEIIKKGNMSLASLLGAVRMSFVKRNPGKPNHYADTLLNDALMKNGIVGHKINTTYVIYNPDDINILR